MRKTSLHSSPAGGRVRGSQDHDDSLIGFIEVSLRSHADGCDPSHPVGFIEGWYVKPVFRGRRIGAKLLREAERWAREAGCHEMASDTWGR